MSREVHVRFWEHAGVRLPCATRLPLYRQAQIWARQGINLDRSTLADWVGRAAWHLRPVHERLLAKLKTSPKLFADETTAPVLDPGRGKTKTGQLWAYARDDRPWEGADPPGVDYVYAPDRKAERPIAHLDGFSGILQVDGYGAYRTLAERRGVPLAFCWAHVRRPFYELAAAGPPPIASEMLRRIAELYKIEDDIRGQSADERRAARQERSRPVVAELEPWLREKLGAISQKTKLAQAIRYTLSRWQGLTRGPSATWTTGAPWPAHGGSVRIAALTPAGECIADGDPQPRRHMIEHLADGLPYQVQAASAAGAGPLLDIQPQVLARQVYRQGHSLPDQALEGPGLSGWREPGPVLIREWLIEQVEVLACPNASRRA